MRTFSDESIDLTVTSPPYDNLRTYNGFIFDFENVAKELFRITKRGGVVVWNVADATINGNETGSSFKQALFFKEIGFNLHDTMIWVKPNPVPTQHTRYQNAFEYMFILSKGSPKSINLLREPSKNAGQIKKKHRSTGGRHDDNNEGFYITGDTKIKNNYWSIPPVGDSGSRKHPAAYPETLAKDHILTWSTPGDLVFDPFTGSGTTGKMALIENRNFIGCEISEDYLKISKSRICEAVI
jgi:site-specific DNA-methyltransferase (adenine-specific)